MNTIDQDTDFDALEADTLEQSIAKLVAQYQRSRSAMLAWIVARYAQILSRHPDFGGSEAERCAYCRLSQQWRWLAQASGGQGHA